MNPSVGRFQQQTKQIQELEKVLAALGEEINMIATVTQPSIARIRAERFEKYCSFFSVLQREQEKLNELYSPILEAMARRSKTDRQLGFRADIRYNSEEHLNAGLLLLDRTRRGPYRDPEALRKALEELWQVCSQGQYTANIVSEALNSLITSFESLEEEVTISSQLRSSAALEDFYNWAFDTRPFTVVTAVTFDGAPLDVLSQGQKGVVLLLLYLGIDDSDTRPLIIDQPEENLDNLSVYNDLITYFRDRKATRQLIIVTHNPNLVLNTDAEQVIIADFNGSRSSRIEYSAGSLENHAADLGTLDVDELSDGILERVCGILEGGDKAFGARKKKYDLSPRVSERF